MLLGALCGHLEELLHSLLAVAHHGHDVGYLRCHLAVYNRRAPAILVYRSNAYTLAKGRGVAALHA